MLPKLKKEIDYNKLPEPIVESLTALIVRIKLILWLRGSLATLAVVIVSILIVMGFDAATIIIAPIYRWSLSLSVFIALLIALYFHLYKPLSQPFTLERVARFVELRHPELQERMSSIIQLCHIDEKSDDFGSQRLIDKLAEEATFDATNVKPTQEINTKSVKPWFIAAGVVVGIIVLLMAIWPLRTIRLMARVIVPSSDVGSFFADTLQVEPGDLNMVRGEPLIISVKTKSSKIDTAYIIKFPGDGGFVKERMIETVLDPEVKENGGFRIFTLSMPQVNKSFRYCIHAGHSVTAKYEIQVEVPPRIDSFDFVYDYPAYTRLGSVLSTNVSGNIEVLNGTKINIGANFNKPIKSARVVVAGRELSDTNLVYINPAHLTCTFVTPASVNDKWQMNIVDYFGFTNALTSYSIVSVKDQSPTVDIYRPIERELTLSSKGRFVINYFGFDDYGLTNSFLEVKKDGREAEIHQLTELVKEEDKVGVWRGSVRFDLSKLKLDNVSKLSVAVCVVDALPVELNGPQIARSLPIIINIDRAAESLSRQSYDMQHDAIQKILKNVLLRLEDSVIDAKKINTEMSAERPDYIQIDEDATEVALELSIVSDLLDDLLGMLDDTVYVALKDGVKRAKQNGVTVAKQNAETIVMLNKNEKRATGRKLRTSLEDSIMMIKGLFQELEKLNKVVEEWLETEELANKQDDLVEDAKDMLADGDMFDEDWIAKQKDLAEEINDALFSNNPEAMKEKLEEVKKATEKLAKDAEELSSLQEKLSEATKDESLEKLKAAIEDALEDVDLSEKWQAAKEAVEDGQFENAMLKAQEAVDEDTKDLVKGAKELEVIGDVLLDNQALKDANSNVANLAEDAKKETGKASEMASENIDEATAVEQQAIQEQQEKAAEALSDVSQGLQQSKSVLDEQITSLEGEIETLQSATAQSDQLPVAPQMDEAMLAAMQAAIDAQAAMEMFETMPQSDVSQAQQAASQAQAQALEAMAAAEQAQAEAMSAEPLDAAAAQAQAAQAQADAIAAQAEATQAQADAAAVQDEAGTAEAAQAQADAAVAQLEAGQAQAAAAQAQNQAQEAMSSAAESPSLEASSAATQAQASAAQAQAAATQAQQIAQQSEAAMQQAQQAMQQAQKAQQALGQMMQQQAEQLGMDQQQMQAMASMNQPPSPPSQGPSQQPSMPGQPSDKPENKPVKEGGGTIDLELLKNIGLTLGDWEKIKGGLKSGVTSESDFDNVPPEYRALVREYFREIASQIQ